jgi:hypothetical protein
MATAPTPDDAAAAARQVLDTRIEVVRRLATDRATVERMRDELAEAEQADAASFAACVRAGWTEAELKGIGFDPPKRRPPGRPRRARQASKAPAPQGAATSEQGSATSEPNGG